MEIFVGVDKVGSESCKISVIVPVYKVVDFLNRCVESIRAQTYDNLEIILVDDGSPDDCPAMCDAWAAKDTRIKVIHKKNGGLSDARNVGIEASTGEYLLFVDSDDYIEPTMCEKLLTAIEREQADIAVCNLYWEYPDRQEADVMQQSDGQVVDRENILEEYFLRSSVAMVVAWNKLCHRDLFFTPEMIRYPVGRLHEDEFTSYRLLYAAKKTVFLTGPLYHYVQRDGSIMSRYGARNIRDLVICAKGYLQWSDYYAPEKRYLMDYAAMNIFWGVFAKCEQTPELTIYKNEVVRFGKELSHLLHHYWWNPYFGKRDKLRYSIFIAGGFEPLRKIWHWWRDK